MTAISLHSQNFYPQKQIINKDTVVIITSSQLRQTNCLLEKGFQYKVSSLSFESILNDSKKVISKQKKYKDFLETENLNLINQINKLEDLNNKNQQVVILYEKEIKYRKTKNFSSKIWGFTIGIAATSIAVLIFK